MKTREMLNEAGLGCGADGPVVQVGTDAYGDLRNATPEQLLDAVIWFYQQSNLPPEEVKIAVSFLRSGFALAQPGGWERVAPGWLRESKRPKGGGVMVGQQGFEGEDDNG